MSPKRKPLLCGDRCTACSSCVQRCPVDAISMCFDERGFQQPNINFDKCINCLQCEKSCPILNPIETDRYSTPKVYACWHKDERVRMTSSSGGAFSAIAEYVLSRGGLVWGAAYVDDLKLRYRFVDSIESLDTLRRSKYVQCEVADTYSLIKEQLKSDRLVLFTGTPCHVKGLYAFLGRANFDNLITTDFICHGVPSPKVFRKYLDWIEAKCGDKLLDFNFRDKKYGCDSGLFTVGIFQNIGRVEFLNKENSYVYGMMHDLFIRECCHKCEANGLRRDADFTIADFWGIGKRVKFDHEEEKQRGISLIATNSNRSVDIFNAISDTLYYTERGIQEAYEGNWNYRYSANRNAKSEDFWSSYSICNSWEELLPFFKPSISEQCKLVVKRYMGPSIANKLRKLIGK